MKRHYFAKSVMLASALMLGFSLTAQDIELIDNGGFETAISENWGINLFTEATVKTDTVAYTGDSAAVFDITTSTGDYWAIELYSKPVPHMDIAQITGEEISFWAKCDEGQTRKLILRFGYYADQADPQGTYDWNGESDYYFDITDEWASFTQIYDPKEGYEAGWVNLRFFTGGYPENDGAKIYLDDVSLMVPDPAASVENNELKSVDVYPNPAHSGYFYVRNLQAGENISIVGMTGQLVRSFVAETETMRISTDGLAKGLYMIEISGVEKKVSKLLIQ